MLNVLLLLCSFVGIVWSAFVFSIIWGWFLVPLGVKAISVAHAVGISALISMYVRNEVKENQSVSDLMWGMFSYPVFILTIAFVAKFFM